MGGGGQMEAVIDTNALVYDYVENSDLHAEASKWLDSLDGWLVPSVVIEEFVFVMKKAGVADGLLQKKVGETLADGRTRFVPVSAGDVKSAVSLLASEKASFMRFNDKLVLSVARRTRAPLLTFDRALRAQCDGLGVRTVPPRNPPATG